MEVKDSKRILVRIRIRLLEDGNKTPVLLNGQRTADHESDSHESEGKSAEDTNGTSNYHIGTNNGQQEGY